MLLETLGDTINYFDNFLVFYSPRLLKKKPKIKVLFSNEWTTSSIFINDVSISCRSINIECKVPDWIPNTGRKEVDGRIPQNIQIEPIMNFEAELLFYGDNIAFPDVEVPEETVYNYHLGEFKRVNYQQILECFGCEGNERIEIDVEVVK